MGLGETPRYDRVGLNRKCLLGLINTDVTRKQTSMSARDASSSMSVGVIVVTSLVTLLYIQN